MSMHSSKDRIKKINQLSFHESVVNKSIVSQIPESNQQMLNEQIANLRQQLQFYKNQYVGQNFYKQDITNQYNSHSKNHQFKELNHQNLKLKAQIEQQKGIISKISQELRKSKKYLSYDDKHKFNSVSQQQIQRLQQQLNRKKTKINQLQYNNSQLYDANKQLKKTIETYQMQKFEKEHKLRQYHQLKHLNQQQQLKISQLTQTITEYLNQIQALNLDIQKIKKQNVIDRQRRSFDRLKAPETITSRFSPINNSRISEFDAVESQRMSLKMMEKTKEYDQLYLKYQSLENEMNSLEQLNHDLQRQRKFLAERLSDIEIHTQGDEVVGQLQNKLVLMSTQLMRLGNLSRIKNQENKDLNMKIKELILRKENLQKQVMERDKLILNYKEQLRIYEVKSSQKIYQSRISRGQSNLKQKNSKLIKQIQRITGLYKQKMQTIKNLDIKVAILQQKNSRLIKQNQQFEKQYRDMIKNNNLSKSNSAQLMNLQAEVKFYKQNNTYLKENVKSLELKLQEARIRFDQLNRQKQDSRNVYLQAQDKVTALQQELRRINDRLDDKEMHVKEIHHKNQEKLIIKMNQIKFLQEKIRSHEKQIERTQRNRAEVSKYDQLVRQIQRLEGIQMNHKLQLSSYQQKIAMLAQENERLTLMINNLNNQNVISDKLKLENSHKDKKIRQLSSQVEILSSRQKNYKQQLNDMRQKLRNCILSQRNYDDNQFKNRQFTDEIQTLKLQLSMRQNELNNLTQKYRQQCKQKYSLLIKIEQYRTKISPSSNQLINIQEFDQKQHQLMRYKKQNERLLAQIKEIGYEGRQNEENYEALSQQILRLNKVLQKRMEQITNYKKQMDFFRHQIKVLEESLQQKNLPKLLSEKTIFEAQSRTRIQIYQAKKRDLQGELDLWKQKYNMIKQSMNSSQEKVSSLSNQNMFLQQKIQQLQYTMVQKSEGFKDIQESLKVTIRQIRQSNVRLQKSVRQIQMDYISKLEQAQNQCNLLRSERKQNEGRLHELQKRLSNVQIQLGSEIKQKNQYISNLNSNSNRSKQEFQQVLRIKSQYEIKINGLSQQLQRLKNQKDQLNIQYNRLIDQNRRILNKQQVILHQKDVNTQTIQTLSMQIQRLNHILAQNAQKIKEFRLKINNNQSQSLQHKQQLIQLRFMLEEASRKLQYQRDVSNERVYKLQSFNKDLKYQIEEKIKDNERIHLILKGVENKENSENQQNMRNIMQEIKLLRQGNENLQKKLGLITREYQQLVSQLQYYKRPKSNHENDEKMRIIGNYQATIKHIKQENTIILSQKNKLQNDLQKLHHISHEIQQRLKISQQRCRVNEQKCKRLEQRNKNLQDRSRNNDNNTRSASQERSSVQKKLVSSVEEINRLQMVLKNKDDQIQQLNETIKQLKLAEWKQTNSDSIRESKGIFVIKQASQLDERSRSASGTQPQGLSRVPYNTQTNDLEHRYNLLDSLNKKLGNDCECYKKKSIQIEFKFNKLKQQFQIVNKFLSEYKQEINSLKEKNKQLLISGQRGNHHIKNVEYRHNHNQFSSPQHNNLYSNQYQYQSQYRQQNTIRGTVSQLNQRGYNQNVPTNQRLEVQAKLLEQIDRLSRINGNLEAQIRDLRLNFNQNLSYRKRYEQNLALTMLLFVQIQSLRARTVSK